MRFLQEKASKKPDLHSMERGQDNRGYDQESQEKSGSQDDDQLGIRFRLWRLPPASLSGCFHGIFPKVGDGTIKTDALQICPEKNRPLTASPYCRLCRADPGAYDGIR